LKADLILVGKILTGEPTLPRAEAVAIMRGSIVAVGTLDQILELRGGDTEVLGDSGSALLPGFVDAHLHFLALARRVVEVDCSAEFARSIGELVARIRAAAAARPVGSWIRAFGYDEFFLQERRPPAVAELDAAAPTHPVRLLHRTGHAAVLNTAAFERIGLSPRPLIHEPARLLHRRIPSAGTLETARLAASASERLLGAGVTAFHDPTPAQDAEALDTLRRWVADGTIRQRVVAYGDPDHFHVREDRGRFLHAGVKIVVTEGSEADEVIERVAAAHAAGAQIALHAVEGGPLVVAVAALRRLGKERVRARRHRIEHATLCPPSIRKEIAQCGATVVTHPDFLYRFGEKYAEEVGGEEEQGWLYPLRGFLDDGIPVALGSDAPIGVAEPLAAIQAATERRTRGGSILGAAQSISPGEAVELHSRGGAAAARLEASIGSIAPGRIADIVVLGADPIGVPKPEIGSIPVRVTVIDGRIAWSG
jgi:predicted amidohydrolase YtcJ